LGLQIYAAFCITQMVLKKNLFITALALFTGFITYSPL